MLTVVSAVAVAFGSLMKPCHLRWLMNGDDVLGARAGPWKAFAKAVIGGAIAAAMLPTVLVAMMLIASLLSNPVDLSGAAAAIGLLLLPFAVALVVTAISSALIGLPVTLALRRTRRESARNYAFAGGACGVAITMLWGAITPAGRPDLSLALLGAVGGTVTARTWWKSARRVPCPRMDPGEARPPSATPAARRPTGMGERP